MEYAKDNTRSEQKGTKQYQEKLHNRLKTLKLEGEAEKDWCQVSKMIIKTSEEIIGKRKNKRNEDWFDEECRSAIIKRNERRKKMLQRETRTSHQKYVNARKEAHRICKRKKEMLYKRK